MMKTNRNTILLAIAAVVLMLAAAFDALAAEASEGEEAVTEAAEAAEAVGEAVLPSEGAEPEAAEPAPAPLPRLRGDLPAEPPRVSLEQTDGTVAEALLAVTQQCGWGLLLTSPAEGKLTLHAADRPADEILLMILEAGQLEAELEGGLLKIIPAAPATAAVADDDVGDVHVNWFKGKFHVKHGKKDRVGVGESVHVAKDETVTEAVSVGGSVVVEGKVHRDAVAVGGSVTLEPGAEVGGEAVAVGGEVIVKPGARLEGNRVSIGGSLGEFVSGMVGFAVDSAGHPGHWILFGVLAKLLRTLVLFVIALLLVAFMPERLGRVRTYLTERPGASTLGGFALVAGLIPFCILLGISFIGIPLIPVAILLLVAMHLIGLTAFMTWLGDKIPLFKDRKSPVLAMFIGLVVLFLVDLIPIIGGLAVTVVAFISGGAVLLTRFGRAPKVAEPSKT